MKRYTQERYFDSNDPDNPHRSWYGPCDAMGPDGTCSACTGLIGHIDGSVSVLDTGKIVRKSPLRTRLSRAWDILRQTPKAVGKAMRT
jgi:hypothetical protein